MEIKLFRKRFSQIKIVDKIQKGFLCGKIVKRFQEGFMLKKCVQISERIRAEKFPLFPGRFYV